LIQSQEATLLVFLIALVAFMGIATPAFLEPRNIQDILVNSSFAAVAAIGMTMVIVAGEIDISVGSMLAVCAVTAGKLAEWGYPIPLVFLATIMVGTLMGMLNGFLVARVRIPAIIVTLGMLSFWRGLVILLTRGDWIRNLPKEFYIGQQSWLGIPVPIWVMVISVVMAGFWMRYTLRGRQIYAVGGNRQAALLAGIPVRRMIFMVLTLNGTLIGLATLIFATRFSVIQSNAGLGFELDVITAVVVGGTSIMGGVGTVWGSLLGVLLLNVISTGLTFLKVSPYWLQAVQGTLILLAVVLDVARRRRTAT
jgi:ribose/xylose/arabinose/galactoside ABC-type transport system permease subunit